MEQVNVDIAEIIKRVEADRTELVIGQANTNDGIVTLFFAQKMKNPPEKVIIEVISGFDVVARKEFETTESGVSGVIKFKLAALSPASNFIAVKNKHENDGSMDRAYMHHVGGYWQRAFWKTFMEDVIHLETTYRRKYSHW